MLFLNMKYRLLVVSWLLLFPFLSVFSTVPTSFNFPRKAPKEFIILNHPYFNPGMFCVFNTVIAFLYDYDKGKYAGLKIDFEDQGLYYDPLIGKNWWEYYFEPINLGSAEKAVIKKNNAEKGILHDYFTQKNLKREQVFELIEKYIKLKPSLLEKINYFTENHFGDHFVIGVHYRGTDKYQEAAPVPYEKVLQSIIDSIHTLQLEDYRVFVATDEQSFLDYIKSYFSTSVISQDIQLSQSGIPLHFNQLSSPYLNGEGAILDCLLLAKSHLLIRTDSRLSLCSAYFNPKVPVITLNTNFYLGSTIDGL